MTEEVASYSILSFKGPDIPAEYRNLIFAHWLRSLRIGNELYKKIEPEHYFENYSRYIENVLTNPNSMVKLAVLSDDRDVVLGFSVSRGDVLDYVHVHRDQRRVGIGSSLIPANVKSFTHITKIGMPIWQRKYKHWRFEPFE